MISFTHTTTVVPAILEDTTLSDALLTAQVRTDARDATWRIMERHGT